MVLHFCKKTVLITGASSGLGRHLAIKYASRGHRIINLSRNVEKMKQLNKELNELNNKENIFFPVDVSNYKKVDNICKLLVKDNSFPNIIINNAAGNFLCRFEKLSPNGFNRIVDIVLKGAFNIYSIFGKEKIKNNGTHHQINQFEQYNQKEKLVFLNISTTYSENSSAFAIPSACAKAGVDNMMKGLTTEWTKYNMRFVGIAPGPIKNSGGADKLDPFGIFKWYNSFNNPSKRMASQEEISELAYYLTSDKADYINGEIIKIDGGEYIKNSGEFNFIENLPFNKFFI